MHLTNQQWDHSWNLFLFNIGTQISSIRWIWFSLLSVIVIYVAKCLVHGLCYVPQWLRFTNSPLFMRVQVGCLCMGLLIPKTHRIQLIIRMHYLRDESSLSSSVDYCLDTRLCRHFKVKILKYLLITYISVNVPPDLPCYRCKMMLVWTQTKGPAW